MATSYWTFFSLCITVLFSLYIFGGYGCCPLEYMNDHGEYILDEGEGNKVGHHIVLGWMGERGKGLSVCVKGGGVREFL